MIAPGQRFAHAFGNAKLSELDKFIPRMVEDGFAVVLCEPGSKKPVCTIPNPRTRGTADKQARLEAKAAGVENWERVSHPCGLKHALTEPGRARMIFRKVQATYPEPLNVAVIPGRSRMVLVDVDSPEQFEAFQSWAEWTVAPELTVKSPGVYRDGVWLHHDGGHVWYTVPDGMELPEGRGKWVAPEGWAVMWGENYALVPPSARPEGPYVLQSPEIVPLPAKLYEAILAVQVHPGTPRNTPKEPGDPADSWAAGISWNQLLQEDSWTLTGKADQCGCPIWTAPGGRADPKSATAHEVGCPKVDTSTGHGPLHIWTDNPPEFLAGKRNVTKLQYVAARDHGGNIAAAMRERGIPSSIHSVPSEPFDGVNDSEGEEKPFTRIVDLESWLAEDYTPPQPSIGALREDGRTMLYPGKWHTVIGLTTAGKSWFALWHAKAVLEAGGVVCYVHFEEGDPGNTLDRLRQLGVPREDIRKRFVWLSNERMWKPGEMAATLATLTEQQRVPALLILDGLIAGASRQGWKVNDPESVQAYRAAYVKAATALGAAVMSLGHPVKDRTRQDEIHSFGSTAWLDEVDGCSFRMVSTDKPIRKGHRGGSWVSVVKDRAGSVAEMCSLTEGKSEVWYSLGEFVMDDESLEMDGDHVTTALLKTPGPDAEKGPDKFDVLAQKIITVLIEHGGRFETVRALKLMLADAGLKVGNDNLEVALMRLAGDGTIEWPITRTGISRPGWLVDDHG